jgi:hypothetical protein
MLEVVRSVRRHAALLCTCILAGQLAGCDAWHDLRRNAAASTGMGDFKPGKLACSTGVDVRCAGSTCSGGRCIVQCEAKSCGVTAVYGCAVSLHPSLGERAHCVRRSP